MAKARTRTVTRYRAAPRRRSSKRGFGGGRKISIAMVAGLIPGITWAAYPATAGNWQHAGERAIAAYTGYYLPEKRFRIEFLNYGLWPLLGGLVVSKAADMLGLNKLVASLKLPVKI